MWTVLVLTLGLCGAFALWDAPDRARRHAAERRAVLDALAALRPDGTTSAVVNHIARRTGQNPLRRSVLGHLAALEEDGLVAVGRRGSPPDLRYRLLVEIPAGPEASAGVATAPLMIYHDGACPLCTAEIAHYRRARGAEALRFTDVSTADPFIGEDLTREAALKRFHVRDHSGALLSGAEAFAALWRTLPGWRWLGRIVGARHVLPLAEAAYRAFLPLRPGLARGLIAAGILKPVRSGRTTDGGRGALPPAGRG